MRRLAAIAICLAVAAANPAIAQQEGPAPGSPITAAPFEELAGWYEVTLKIPPTQCRLKQGRRRRMARGGRSDARAARPRSPPRTIEILVHRASPDRGSAERVVQFQRTRPGQPRYGHDPGRFHAWRRRHARPSVVRRQVHRQTSVLLIRGHAIRQAHDRARCAADTGRSAAVRPFSFHGFGCPLHTSAAATDNTRPIAADQRHVFDDAVRDRKPLLRTRPPWQVERHTRSQATTGPSHPVAGLWPDLRRAIDPQCRGTGPQADYERNPAQDRSGQWSGAGDLQRQFRRRRQPLRGEVRSRHRICRIGGTIVGIRN